MPQDHAAKLDDSKMKLLLLSNGRVLGGEFLSYALPWIQDHFQASPEHRKKILFVPYAQAEFVLKRDKTGRLVEERDGKPITVNQWEEYTALAAKALNPLGIDVEMAHPNRDPREMLKGKDGIFVGGGNTYLLLDTLNETGLGDAIKEEVKAGLPYMGASAGTAIMCPTLRTSNDMPVLGGRMIDRAFGLLPFQINAHYIEGELFHGPDKSDITLFSGERRWERLNEYHQHNDLPVAALREGSALRITGKKIELMGDKPITIFKRDEDSFDTHDKNATVLSALMDTPRSRQWNRS